MVIGFLSGKVCVCSLVSGRVSAPGVFFRSKKRNVYSIIAVWEKDVKRGRERESTLWECRWREGQVAGRKVAGGKVAGVQVAGRAVLGTRFLAGWIWGDAVAWIIVISLNICYDISESESEGYEGKEL